MSLTQPIVEFDDAQYVPERQLKRLARRDKAQEAQEAVEFREALKSPDKTRVSGSATPISRRLARPSMSACSFAFRDAFGATSTVSSVESSSKMTSITSTQ